MPKDSGRRVPRPDQILTTDEFWQQRLVEAIRQLEEVQREIGQGGQARETGFHDSDQKANQLHNMLSSVIKTLNEMRGIGAGSRSGL